MIKKQVKKTTENNLDAIYREYFFSKLRESEEDIKNGRVITLEELKTFVDGLEEKYATGNLG